ncbi:MAG TPA: hypothetical protein VEH04_12545 [Verrucomicrobiae bacterium]|nr:hypothetical protein [Verrucomicrobiae bacterium]
MISKDASLEKLVDDLTMVVQGADDYARAIGAEVPIETQREVAGRLQNLKRNCERLKNHAMHGAQATDKLLRRNPYAAVALTFVAGLVIGGALLRRK